MVEHAVQQFISSHRSKPGQEDKSGYTGSRNDRLVRRRQKKRRQTFHNQINHVRLFFPHRRRFDLWGRAENILNICFGLLQTILNTSCRRPVSQGAAQASSFGLIRRNPQEQQASPASILQSFRFISKTKLRPTVVAMVTVVYNVTHVWRSVYPANDQQIISHPSWTCQLPAGAAEHGSDILHRDVFSFHNNNKAVCL